MDQSKRARGRWGEARAAAHYVSLGYTVIARNWRSPEREVPGELDLIVRRGELVVFCEVKARRTGEHGGGALAVGVVKQARIKALAATWLRTTNVDPDAIRFDVIAIDGGRLRMYDAAF